MTAATPLTEFDERQSCDLAESQLSAPVVVVERKVTIKSLLSESAIYGIAKIVDPAIGFLLLPLVTTLLTPQNYGLIAIFTATSHVMFTVCSLGIHLAFFRYFTEAKTEQEQQAITNTSVVLSIVYWCTILPLGIFFAQPLSRILFNVDSSALVLVMVSTSLVQMVDSLGCNLLQASGRAWAYLINTLLNTVAVRFLAFGLILYGAGAWGWITGEAIGRTAAMLVIVAMAMPRLRLRATTKHARELSWYGMVLVPAMLSFYLMTITDKYLIRALTLNPFEQVGLYTVGERIAGIMHMANLAIIVGWQRFAFQNMHEEDGESLIGYGLFVYLLGAGYMVLGLTLLGDDLTYWLIASQFNDGLVVIVPLTLAAFCGGVANMCDIGLHKRRWPHLISVVTTIAALANVALNFAVIPKYGIQGAAWATLICQMLRLITIYLASQYAFYIAVDWRRITSILMLYASAFVFGKLFDSCGWWVSGTLQVGIVMFIPLLVWKLPILSCDERAQVQGLFDRMKRLVPTFSSAP